MSDVLICSAVDPSGGAGFIADVRVVSELGARPIGVVTALTVQNTAGLAELHPSDPEVVAHQLALLLTDVEVRAVKIGMLGSLDVARAVAGALDLVGAPVVWDPIAGPTLGELAPLPIVELAEILRPHLALITPNAAELALLGGDASELASRLQCAVLAKGGHLGGDDSVDVLFHDAGVSRLTGSRVAGGEHVHGTGCALSSAIAAHLARGRTLVEACRQAKQWVAARIASPARPGRGAPAIV